MMSPPQRSTSENSIMLPDPKHAHEPDTSTSSTATGGGDDDFCPLDYRGEHTEEVVSAHAQFLSMFPHEEDSSSSSSSSKPLQALSNDSQRTASTAASSVSSSSASSSLGPFKVSSAPQEEHDYHSSGAKYWINHAKKTEEVPSHDPNPQEAILLYPDNHASSSDEPHATSSLDPHYYASYYHPHMPHNHSYHYYPHQQYRSSSYDCDERGSASSSKDPSSSSSSSYAERNYDPRRDGGMPMYHHHHHPSAYPFHDSSQEYDHRYNHQHHSGYRYPPQYHPPYNSRMDDRSSTASNSYTHQSSGSLDRKRTVSHVVHEDRHAEDANHLPYNNKKPKHAPLRKVPGKPKRPLSAYNLFFKDERARILKENNHEGVGGFAHLAQTISAEWKKISAPALAKYKDLADQDMKRYRQEMKHFHQKEADDS